jgi:hypothetical protein
MAVTVITSDTQVFIVLMPNGLNIGLNQSINIIPMTEIKKNVSFLFFSLTIFILGFNIRVPLR